MSGNICQRCERKERQAGYRYCAMCRKEVIADARLAGKVREYVRGTFNDARGRKQVHSSAVMGGVPTTNTDGGEYS